MKEVTFLDMIKEHFRYPLEVYGFSVVFQSEKRGFSDQMIAFASGRCGIGFILDRGVVEIKVASANTTDSWAQGIPNLWFEIGLVIALLPPRMTLEELMDFYPHTKGSNLIRIDIDLRLAEWARMILPYWDRVIELAKSGELNSYENELKELSKRQSDEVRRQIREQVERRRKGGGKDRVG